jgi:hypothetical protein
MLDLVPQLLLYLDAVASLEVPVDDPARDLVYCQAQITRLLDYSFLMGYLKS